MIIKCSYCCNVSQNTGKWKINLQRSWDRFHSRVLEVHHTCMFNQCINVHTKLQLNYRLLGLITYLTILQLSPFFLLLIFFLYFIFSLSLSTNNNQSGDNFLNEWMSWRWPPPLSLSPFFVLLIFFYFSLYYIFPVVVLDEYWCMDDVVDDDLTWPLSSSRKLLWRPCVCSFFPPPLSLLIHIFTMCVFSIPPCKILKTTLSSSYLLPLVSGMRRIVIGKWKRMWG